MPTPFVAVMSPDGTQVVDLASERVLVGSAITCQVVVERPEFAREHMLLSPRPDGCFVAIARGAPTPIMYNGEPFERGVVPWGAEVSIGSVRFVLNDGTVSRDLFVASTSAAAKRPDGKPHVNPVILGAVAIVIPLAGWMLLSSPDDGIPHTTERPPELFPAAEPACPFTDSVQAGNLAAEAARMAIAKAERMPFASRDGVEAVHQYAVASACYAVAGDSVHAQDQRDQETTLKARINEDFYNHRFRLERALEQSRKEDALVEVRLLRNLLTPQPVGGAEQPSAAGVAPDTTGGPEGRYMTWLASLERRLVLALDYNPQGGK